MDYADKRYVIGIDLGTTNCAVSYVDLTQNESKPNASKKDLIKLFKVPQLTGPGEVTQLPVLPSFLYIPGEYDIAEDAITINLNRRNKNFVGAFARDHGSKIPGRLISSAKSWLCHSNVDRKAPILPWGAKQEVSKLSPVEATASYLKHIKKAWNSLKGTNEEEYLEHQFIIITVPASFDEVARDLTVEAAKMAGLENITLLEEPLAAFYSWLIRYEQKWSQYVNPNELILVCDVGGGTTDFTLITLREVNGSPRFERIAVGDHLILGGDNIDLALARHIEMKFGKKTQSLSGDKYKALCHQCRNAKELILDGKMDEKTITMMGSGSKLIAGTLSAVLARKTIEQIVLDGFFPLVEQNTVLQKPERKGISEFGLPYEPEPAITKHLGWFLEKNKAEVDRFLGKSHQPDLILFNGGSLKPGIIQEKIRASIRHWFGQANTELPRVLDNPDPDLAVALGAAYYGLVKIGKGVRVGSGSARSYYLGITEKDNPDQKKALCLIERGLEEGSHIELTDKKFEVLTNQPVSFDIFSSSFRSGDTCGDVVSIDDTLSTLPPIQTVVQFGKKGVKSSIPVTIEAGFTEMGTLALWCKSQVSEHRWKLQFQLRDSSAISEVADQEIFESETVSNAVETIKQAFTANSDKTQLERLVKDIAAVVDRNKEKWPLSFIRTLADECIALKKIRQTGPEYENRWLNLTGFALRPGFGDGLDEHRIKQIWKLYHNGPIFDKNAQVRSEWWIFWRRVAGGLKPGQQRQFIQDLSPVLMAKKDAPKNISPQEAMEMWMAVANMEFLLVKDKINWGKRLLSQIAANKGKPQFLWSLSRIGARELFYGPVDRVIPAQEAGSWIKKLMHSKWSNPIPASTAIAQLARKTGDRIRDVDPALVAEILDWMAGIETKNKKSKELLNEQQQMIQDVVPIKKQEENSIFGESLPSGLILHT